MSTSFRTSKKGSQDGTQHSIPGLEGRSNRSPGLGSNQSKKAKPKGGSKQPILGDAERSIVTEPKQLADDEAKGKKRRKLNTSALVKHGGGTNTPKATSGSDQSGEESEASGNQSSFDAFDDDETVAGRYHALVAEEGRKLFHNPTPSAAGGSNPSTSARARPTPFFGSSTTPVHDDDPFRAEYRRFLWKDQFRADHPGVEDVPEPLWIHLYEDNMRQAEAALAMLLVESNRTMEMLAQAGYPRDRWPELLRSSTFPIVEAIVENCDQTSAHSNVNTVVTTNVPVLTELTPGQVEALADRLLADFSSNGKRYNLLEILGPHQDTITVMFQARQLLRDHEDHLVWSKWAVPKVCTSLKLAFPKGAAVKGKVTALTTQLANIRFDMSARPEHAKAGAYAALVHKVMRESGQKLSTEQEARAVHDLIKGFIAKKTADGKPIDIINPANQALYDELSASNPPITRIRTFLTQVAALITKAEEHGVIFDRWYGARSLPAARHEQPHASGGQRSKQQGKQQAQPRANPSNVDPCPNGLCYGCGRSYAGPGKLCNRAACKGHPDRNTSNVPFVQSSTFKTQEARGYQYAHELDRKARADGTAFTAAQVQKIESLKGPNPQQGNSNKRKHGELTTPVAHELTTLCASSEDPTIVLPRFTVSVNKSNLTVDALLDTGALQANYVNEDLARWIKSRGGKCVSGEDVVISLAARQSFTSSSSMVTFDVTFRNEASSSTERISSVTARVLDSQYQLIIGLPFIRLHNLCDKLPSFFKSNDTSAPVSKLARRLPAHAATTRSTVFDSVIKGAAAAANSRRLACADQRPPIANHQLCIIGEIKAKQELIDTAPDLDQVVWPENPFDIQTGNDPSGSSTCLDILDKIELHGSTSLRSKLRSLCEKYRDIFSESVRAEPARIPPMELKVDPEKWQSNKNRGPPRPQSREKQKEIAKQVNNYLKLGVIQPVNASEYSQVHLVPKPSPNEWRFCLDFVRLNDCTQGVDGWPIPNIQHMLNRIGERKAKVFGVMDMTSGYHQAPISASSQIHTAFICFMGIFCWLRVPMGLKNAASYFQRVMATVVLAGLIFIICELYIDDIMVFGQHDDDFILNLEQVFKRLRQYHVTLNPKKCRFGMASVEYVGHVVSETGVTFSPEKREKVLDFPLPATQKELQAFLGLVNYFRDHVPDITGHVKPLRILVDPKKKNQRLTWQAQTESQFYKVRDLVANCPALFFVDDTAPIIVMTDASDVGIGSYIYQLIDNKERPIIFMSKSLHGAELNWSTIEKEAYAIFFTLTKYNHLLRDNKFLLRTDHKNLTYINLGSSQKVQRWKLALQEFDFNIEHVAGTSNSVADAFSRLCLNNQPARKEEESEESIAALEVFRSRIPEEHYRKISSHHNSTCGHFGVEKTLDRLLASKLKWKHMREHVRQFIQQCPVCQKLSEQRREIKTHPFTTASYSPMDVLNIDTIGPVAKDSQNNEHIIVIIDCFTRWIELFPVPDTSALSAARALLQHVGRFGTPGILRSDRGSQFVNNIITEFNSLVVTDPQYSLAYSKEENAIVERANKEVLRHLRAIISDQRVQDNWSSDQLPLVQRILNAEEKTNTGISPAELLFGKAVDLGRRILRPPVSQPQQSLSDYWDKMLKQQALLIQVAQETQRKHDTHHMSVFDPDFTEYPVNSFVLVTPPEGNRPKLALRKKGPYKVVNCIGSKYTLQDLVSLKHFDIHISNLSPFNYDSTRTDPTKIALDDAQEFVIESILAHRGDKNRRKTMEFLVRWDGYSDDANSWEPYANLRDTEPLLIYLRTNRLKSLIPNKHK